MKKKHLFIDTIIILASLGVIFFIYAWFFPVIPQTKLTTKPECKQVFLFPTNAPLSKETIEKCTLSVTTYKSLNNIYKENKK